MHCKYYNNIWNNIVLIKNNLINNGLTQEEADSKVDEIKQQKIEATKTICKLLRSDFSPVSKNNIKKRKDTTGSNN